MPRLEGVTQSQVFLGFRVGRGQRGHNGANARVRKTVAVDAASGDIVWEAPPLSCEGRKSCSPGQTGAVTAIPGVVFTGSLSGVLQALDAQTGSVLWQYDTVKSYDAVNGARAHGGALDGPGPVVVDGWVYVTSGYAKFGGSPGNVLLAFSRTK